MTVRQTRVERAATPLARDSIRKIAEATGGPAPGAAAPYRHGNRGDRAGDGAVWSDPGVHLPAVHATAAMTMDLYGHLVDASLWQAARLIGGTTGGI
jgi:hypothetical protein